jgi:hypothetical protein
MADVAGDEAEQEVAVDDHEADELDENGLEDQDEREESDEDGLVDENEREDELDSEEAVRDAIAQLEAGAPAALFAAAHEAVRARHEGALLKACLALATLTSGSDENDAALVQAGAPAALVAAAHEAVRADHAEALEQACRALKEDDNANLHAWPERGEDCFRGPCSRGGWGLMTNSTAPRCSSLAGWR